MEGEANSAESNDKGLYNYQLNVCTCVISYLHLHPGTVLWPSARDKQILIVDSQNNWQMIIFTGSRLVVPHIECYCKQKEEYFSTVTKMHKCSC